MFKIRGGYCIVILRTVYNFGQYYNEVIAACFDGLQLTKTLIQSDQMGKTYFG